MVVKLTKESKRGLEEGALNYTVYSDEHEDGVDIVAGSAMDAMKIFNHNYVGKITQIHDENGDEYDIESGEMIESLDEWFEESLNEEHPPVTRRDRNQDMVTARDVKIYHNVKELAQRCGCEITPTARDTYDITGKGADVYNMLYQAGYKDEDDIAELMGTYLESLKEGKGLLSDLADLVEADPDELAESSMTLSEYIEEDREMYGEEDEDVEVPSEAFKRVTGFKKSALVFDEEVVEGNWFELSDLCSAEETTPLKGDPDNDLSYATGTCNGHRIGWFATDDYGPIYVVE